MQNQQISRWAIVLVALSAFLIVGLVDPALAGPGGIIQAVGETFWGKVGICVFGLIFSPFIIWYWSKRIRHVKQVRKDMEKLASVYPQYRWLDVRDKTTEIFHFVWSAWSQEKMSLASQHVTHWYWQNQQLTLDQWQRDGVENICRLQSIKNITPLYVEHIEDNNGNGSRVVLEINANVVDYLQERNGGKKVKGNKKDVELETIWTLAWQDGQWKLNLIEDSSAEFAYFNMPTKAAGGTAAIQ